MIVIDTKEKEMIYSRAYMELYVIILNLTEDMKEKIPKNVIENISRKMDKTYDFKLENNDIFNTEYMVETKALFLELYIRYIAEDEEDFWEVYKEKRDEFFKREMKKEYVVKIENVKNYSEQEKIEEIRNLPVEVRGTNIIEKLFSGIINIIKSIFS